MSGYQPANRGNRSSNRIGATVSRRLRAAGFNVVSPDRRHVTRCMTVQATDDRVSVLVDYGLTAKNNRIAAEVAETLVGWTQVSDLSTDSKLCGDGAVFIWFDYTPLIRRK